MIALIISNHGKYAIVKDKKDREIRTIDSFDTNTTEISFEIPTKAVKDTPHTGTVESEENLEKFLEYSIELWNKMTLARKE